jgi:hypothetical protein
VAAERAKADAIRRAADPRLLDEITPPRRPLPPGSDDETPAELLPAEQDGILPARQDGEDRP